MTTTLAVCRTAQITASSGTVLLDPRTAASEQFMSATLTDLLRIVLLDPIATGSVLAPDDFDGARLRIIRPYDASTFQATVYDRSVGVSHVLRTVAPGEWAEFIWATLGGATGQWRVVASGTL